MLFDKKVRGEVNRFRAFSDRDDCVLDLLGVLMLVDQDIRRRIGFASRALLVVARSVRLEARGRELRRRLVGLVRAVDPLLGGPALSFGLECHRVRCGGIERRERISP